MLRHKEASLKIRDFDLSVKSVSEDGVFAGYGSVFGVVDSYREIVAKGAFKDSLGDIAKKGRPVPVLWQHRSGQPIGVYEKMTEDDTGLYVEGKLADTERGREAYSLLKMKPRPAYSGLSIGFLPKKWSVRTRPEEPRRTLEAVDLMEVSLVTFPANPKARVTGVKSGEDIRTVREFEDFLRDVGGFSHAAAKAIASGGFKASDPRDEDAGQILEGLLGPVLNSLKMEP